MTDRPDAHTPKPGRPKSEPDSAADPLDEMRARIADIRDYDERALDQYASFSYYLSLRVQGMPQAQVASLTCERFGHDAPRGLCLRCGLGTDMAADRDRERNRERQRIMERERWLAER